MGNQRGLAQRIERMLEDGVGDAFARVFGGPIVPQEIESLLRREASDGVRRLAGERFLAPNDYVITLSASDYNNVIADLDITSDTFAKHLAGYIGDQGWQTYGEVVVRFEQADGLHTGQFRARAVVNPDADPRPSASTSRPPESKRASTAEPGVPAMTDNPSYRGQGRPGDEYYDEQYGRPQEDPRAGAPEQQRPPYPPEQGYAPGYEQGGYPPRQGYAEQGYGYPQQPAGYGPGHDQGYRPAPQGYGPPPQYGPPPGTGYPPPAGDYDYGRQAPGRHEEPAHGRHDQRPGYPEPGYQQPGYQQPGYPRPEYGQPEYGRYEQGGYPPPPPAPAPAAPDYDYGQQSPSGYGSFAPPAAPAAESEYAAGGHGVTLQLDDGSGRTYQLREGANVIGRGQDAQFRLPDTGVSRRHLEIRWDGQVAMLQDLNSTNGTTVNNAPVQEWQLADGDVIRLGHSEIVVRLH
ncbi:MAG: DUF3662 domain-containing protein [Mycolicibacterium sp.]|nr:FhaA domain-containing protein [Mycolicibacterium sp.]MCB1292132.1 DUF3662 domain-containing protein [Mycobacterium sp.]MCB9410071.1 DUF3662 domain-containing protein [Mycolicibacterium sp.]